MIEVDDSVLTEDDRDFLKRWAEALEVTVEVLVARILSASLDGDHYVEKRPKE